MTEAPANNRHRFRFTLRTMFVALTFIVAPLGWASYQLNWIRQRHEFLADQIAIFDAHTIERDDPNQIEYCAAPRLLSLFGERGRASVGVWVDAHYEEKLSASDIERIRTARRLFPETEPLIVNTWDKPDGGSIIWSGPVPPEAEFP